MKDADVLAGRVFERWRIAKLDASNPLHRASFWLEELKYGPGERRVEAVTFEEIEDQFRGLLADLNLTDVSAEQVVDAARYYGGSFALIFRIPEAVALSIFVDGLLHALALAAGKTAEPPE